MMHHPVSVADGLDVDQSGFPFKGGNTCRLPVVLTN